MATGQRKRDKKTSKGTARGSKSVRLDSITKVLLGGGILRNINKENNGRTRKSPTQTVRFDSSERV